MRALCGISLLLTTVVRCSRTLSQPFASKQMLWYRSDGFFSYGNQATGLSSSGDGAEPWQWPASNVLPSAPPSHTGAHSLPKLAAHRQQATAMPMARSTGKPFGGRGGGGWASEMLPTCVLSSAARALPRQLSLAFSPSPITQWCAMPTRAGASKGADGALVAALLLPPLSCAGDPGVLLRRCLSRHN